MNKTDYIRRLINENSKTLKEFSEKAGVPYTTLHSILNRGIGNASVDNVIKICKALGISVDSLDNLYEFSNERSHLVAEPSTEYSTENKIYDLAAHGVGHSENLSDEEREDVKLAIQIALAKHKKTDKDDL